MPGLFFFLCVLAAIALPFALWRWHVARDREIYAGPASVLNVGILGKDSVEKDHDYVSVALPTARQSLLLRVSKARLARLGKSLTEVVITVRKTPFGEEYIHSVVWPGSDRAEITERNGRRIAFGLYFLLLGMATLLFLPVSASPLLLHLALYTSALVFAVGGYTFTLMNTAGNNSSSYNEGQARVLGIPVGRGSTGLIAMTLLCLIANAALFWTPSFLVLLGMNTAFALGGCVAHLQRSLQR